MAIRDTTPEEAQALIGRGYRYIDVRTEPEFATGHPANAVNIPVVFVDPATRQSTINPAFVRVVEAHFAKSAPIVVGCQSGARSQRAAELLVQAGYTTVVNMRGGFGGARDDMGRTVVSGWSQCGLPVCTRCSADHTYASLQGTAA